MQFECIFSWGFWDSLWRDGKVSYCVRNFSDGVNGVRPLRLCFANPPLPKGEARALPETFSL